MSRCSKCLTLCAFVMLGIGIAPPDGQASGPCGEYYCKGLVREMTFMSGRVRIALDLDASELANITNCGLVDDRYFILWPTQTLYKEMLVALRSAQLAERQVLIRTLSGAECDINYIRAY